jgi:hypothetical protein
MIKTMLALTLALTMGGTLAGCADREEGPEEGGGGGEVIQPAPDDREDREEDGLKEPIGPRGE